ncbi:hypothetical protein GQ44DRAFT_705204 [Phaeosphaeriaceae sp. PMI808]|nr:hypothetical protein GQ44DRAFT_705204 [Phaeosphaeriaceae sp. PMI808]
MMTQDEEEYFLGSQTVESQYMRLGWKKSFTKRFIYLFSTFNLLILSANILIPAHRVYFQKPALSTSTCYNHFPNHLLGAVVDYEDEPQLFTKFQDSLFTGSPKKETDKAWHQLMENMVIRVTEDELTSRNQTSLPLPRGGFMAWLGVHHELHCIKFLRQYKYLDYYYPDTKPGSPEHAHLSVHADHCIEMLRQSALCHADGSLTTFKWSPSATKPMLDLTRPAHKCVNWNTLTESLQDRFVGQDEMDHMTKPDFHI